MSRLKSLNTLSCFYFLYNVVTVERFQADDLVGIMLYIRLRITHLPYPSAFSQEYVLVSGVILVI